MGVLSDLDNATSPSFYVKKARSAYGSRQHRSNQAFTSVNENAVYYMDVGVWAGGADGKAKSTFGLVCGSDILLCSWLNLCESGVPPADSFEIRFSSEYNVTPICVPLSAGSQRFLKAAKAKNRVAIVEAATTLKELTNPNEPLVIIPDLHLTLYRDTRTDRFRYVDNSGRPSSLDSELRMLVDTAKTANARVIQVGDMYEVWESEILLRYQYLEMYRFACRLRREYNVDIRNDYGHMLKTGKVIPRDTEINSYTYAATTQQFSEGQIEHDGITFWDTDAISGGIRRVRPELFRSQVDPFDHRIHGNHDNFLENRYWSEIADEMYRSHPMLGRPTIGSKPAPDHLRFGPVWIDHGHRWDWHNADDAFWKEDRGFDLVVSFVAGASSTLFGKRSWMQDNALWVSNSLPDLVDYEMRLPALRRTDEVFQAERDVKLVVMGHTHSPTIIESNARVPLLPMDSGYLTYSTGEYWYLGATEEDRREQERKRSQRERDEAYERDRKLRVQRNWDKW